MIFIGSHSCTEVKDECSRDVTLDLGNIWAKYLDSLFFLAFFHMPAN